MNRRELLQALQYHNPLSLDDEVRVLDADNADVYSIVAVEEEKETKTVWLKVVYEEE
jgi:hypothetical protein